jgi:phage terminase large subunit-like protein
MERNDLELNLRPCGQGYRDMAPRVEVTTEVLLNGKLRHGGHPVLTSAASSATLTKDPAGNAKPDKGRANGRIDPLVAMIMAIGEMRLGASAADSGVPILVF